MICSRCGLGLHESATRCISCGAWVDHVSNTAHNLQIVARRSRRVLMRPLSRKHRWFLIALSVVIPAGVLFYAVSSAFIHYHRFDFIVVGASLIALLFAIGIIEWRATGLPPQSENKYHG